MFSRLKHLLKGIVHVDEFYIGGHEDQKRRRSKGAKKLVVLAIEILEDGLGRAYTEMIEIASSKELAAFLESMCLKKLK